MVLDASLLSTQNPNVLIKCKWSNPGKGVALSPVTWRCSYWKVSLQVPHDYERPTYFHTDTHTHTHAYIYIYIYNLFALTARSSLTLFHPPPSLSTIATDRFSRLHPVFLHIWCMLLFAGRPTQVFLNVGVHKKTTLMSSSLLLQQWSASLFVVLGEFVRWEVGGHTANV